MNGISREKRSPFGQITGVLQEALVEYEKITTKSRETRQKKQEYYITLREAGYSDDEAMKLADAKHGTNVQIQSGWDQTAKSTQEAIARKQKIKKGKLDIEETEVDIATKKKTLREGKPITPSGRVAEYKLGLSGINPKTGFPYPPPEKVKGRGKFRPQYDEKTWKLFQATDCYEDLEELKRNKDRLIEKEGYTEDGINAVIRWYEDRIMGEKRRVY